MIKSLSARRAWIEILESDTACIIVGVALRKESVDRNIFGLNIQHLPFGSLSARRAWIEIFCVPRFNLIWLVALRKESVDRNNGKIVVKTGIFCRSPQGERG